MMRKLNWDEISQKRQKSGPIQAVDRLPLTVLVDNVRSLYNVGSIFRTSDGVMVQHLLLAGYTPLPPRKEIEKTALGATASVPWSHARDPVASLQLLKSEGLTLCCLEQTDKSIPYYEIQKQHFPLCLVLGSEVAGVSSSLIELCDFAIEIPMFGKKHSLNVAVAYGIAVFHLSRVWRNTRDH
ncbi:MAG TPA: RNA methyltransferase [Bacteroidota bacterium]|nr:RNA methyltransferase [Bacteroidota bacterium]